MGKNQNTAGTNVPENKSEKGLISITVEDKSILSSGSDLFDMGKVIDTDISNMEIKYKVEASKVATGNTSAMNIPETTIDKLTDMVAIMLLPTLGGRLGSKRVQLAFKDQFVNAVGDAYYHSDVSEADLIKLFMYNESLGALLMWVGVGLCLTSVYSKVNAPVCQGILRALGLPYSALTRDRQRWIDVYNRLVGLLNDKFYLASNAAIEQYYYLLNHIFLDGNSQKAQPILFRPVVYTDIDEIDGTLRPDSEVFNGANTNILSQPQLTLEKFDLIVSRAEDFSNSAWYSQVSPILFHLYGDKSEGLYKFEKFVEKKISFTFNYQVLNAIRNSRIANGLTAQDQTETGVAVIWEDQAGYIHQGAFGTDENIKGMLTPAIYSYSDNDHKSRWYGIDNHLCNLDFFPASNADKLDAHSFYYIERPAKESSAAAILDPYNYIEWCSHTLIIRMSSIKLIQTDGSAEETKLTDYVVFPTGAATVGLSSAKCTSVTSVSDLKKMITFSCNNCSKNFYFIEMSGGQPYQIAVAGITPYVHDKDNLVMIQDVTLKNFYLQLTYDCMTFNVPAFSGRK